MPRRGSRTARLPSDRWPPGRPAPGYRSRWRSPGGDFVELPCTSRNGLISESNMLQRLGRVRAVEDAPVAAKAERLAVGRRDGVRGARVARPRLTGPVHGFGKMWHK